VRGAEQGGGVVDRTRVPVPGAARPVGLPRVSRFSLAGGLDVIVAERRALPVVDVQLLTLGGSAALGASEAGLASLMASLLDEGTSSRSSLDLAHALDHLGASFYSAAGFDATEAELNVLSHHLPAALDILAEILLHPSFPASELERVRSERLARIVQELDDPRAVATHAFARVVFGEQHPWGSPVLGTPRALESLSRDDVVRFHRDHVHPGCATLIVSGDVDAVSVERLLSERFGDWRASAKPHWQVAPPPEVARCVSLVDRPGAPQSEIRVGRVAVSRRTEDYFALTVMNTVLGGSFTSRLNSILREQKGFTYGAGSGFSMRRTPGPFVAQAAVHTPVTAEAVGDILREIGRMGDELVPPAELERAKRYVALRLPQRFESVADVTARLSESVLYDLPEDYFGQYVDRILAVTAEEVRAAARTHLAPEGMAVVVAGDREAVEGPLAHMEIGPMEVLPSLPWAPRSGGADAI